MILLILLLCLTLGTAAPILEKGDVCYIRCHGYTIDTCGDGLQCTGIGKKDKKCGETKICEPSYETLCKNVHNPFADDLSFRRQLTTGQEGALCEWNTIACDRGGPYPCNAGLECTERKYSNGCSYTVCAKPPTPAPTPAPTFPPRKEGETCKYDNGYCMIQSNIKNWNCEAGTECKVTESNIFCGDVSRCKAIPPPTPAPTPPTPAPTPAPTYGAVRFHDTCRLIGGSVCDRSRGRFAVQDIWPCEGDDYECVYEEITSSGCRERRCSRKPVGQGEECYFSYRTRIDQLPKCKDGLICVKVNKEHSYDGICLDRTGETVPPTPFPTPAPTLPEATTEGSQCSGPGYQSRSCQSGLRCRFPDDYNFLTTNRYCLPYLDTTPREEWPELVNQETIEEGYSPSSGFATNDRFLVLGSNSARKVTIYDVNTMEKVQTITRSHYSFGSTVTISKSSKYLAVSAYSFGYSGKPTRHGLVFLFKLNEGTGLYENAHFYSFADDIDMSNKRCGYHMAISDNDDYLAITCPFARGTDSISRGFLIVEKLENGVYGNRLTVIQKAPISGQEDTGTPIYSLSQYKDMVIYSEGYSINDINAGKTFRTFFYRFGDIDVFYTSKGRRNGALVSDFIDPNGVMISHVSEYTRGIVMIDVDTFTETRAGFVRYGTSNFDRVIIDYYGGAAVSEFVGLEYDKQLVDDNGDIYFDFRGNNYNIIMNRKGVIYKPPEPFFDNRGIHLLPLSTGKVLVSKYNFDTRLVDSYTFDFPPTPAPTPVPTQPPIDFNVLNRYIVTNDKRCDGTPFVDLTAEKMGAGNDVDTCKQKCTDLGANCKCFVAANGACVFYPSYDLDTDWNYAGFTRYIKGSIETREFNITSYAKNIFGEVTYAEAYGGEIEYVKFKGLTKDFPYIRDGKTLYYVEMTEKFSHVEVKLKYNHDKVETGADFYINIVMRNPFGEVEFDDGTLIRGPLVSDPSLACPPGYTFYGTLNQPMEICGFRTSKISGTNLCGWDSIGEITKDVSERGPSNAQYDYKRDVRYRHTVGKYTNVIRSCVRPTENIARIEEYFPVVDVYKDDDVFYSMFSSDQHLINYQYTSSQDEPDILDDLWVTLRFVGVDSDIFNKLTVDFIKFLDKDGKELKTASIDDLSISDQSVRIYAGEAYCENPKLTYYFGYKYCGEGTLTCCKLTTTNWAVAKQKGCSGTAYDNKNVYTVQWPDASIDACRKWCQDSAGCVGVYFWPADNSCKRMEKITGTHSAWRSDGSTPECHTLSVSTIIEPPARDNSYGIRNQVSTVDDLCEHTWWEFTNGPTTFLKEESNTEFITLKLCSDWNKYLDNTYFHGFLSSSRPEGYDALLDAPNWGYGLSTVNIGERPYFNIHGMPIETKYVEIKMRRGASAAVDVIIRQKRTNGEPLQRENLIGRHVLTNNQDIDGMVHVIPIRLPGDSSGTMDDTKVKPRMLSIFSMMCDQEAITYWSNSNTVTTILELTSLDWIEHCDRADRMLAINENKQFNDHMMLLYINFENAFNVIKHRVNTARGFLDFETSNEERFPASVESITSALSFLQEFDVEFPECGKPRVDTRTLAKELFLAYRRPEYYFSECFTGYRKEETYVYRNEWKSKGLSNAPCINNAMCNDDGYVCVSYKCVKLEDAATIKYTCPATQALVAPSHYVMKNRRDKSFGCGGENYYTDTSFGDFIEWFDPIQTHGKLTIISKYQSPNLRIDEYYKQICPLITTPYNRQVSPLSYYAYRGNEQSCGQFQTDDFTDVGISVKPSVEGDLTPGCQYSTSRNFFDTYKGIYPRLVPHKPVENVKPVTTNYDNDEIKTFPVATAFPNGVDLGAISDMLDLKCSYEDFSKFSIYEVSEIDPETCADQEGCQWNDALDKCVASREAVQSFACPGFTSERQCLLSGFCKWDNDPDSVSFGCQHEEHGVYSTSLEKICPWATTPESCASLGQCFWDFIMETCEDSLDQVVVHDRTFEVYSAFNSAGRTSKVFKFSPKGGPSTLPFATSSSSGGYLPFVMFNQGAYDVGSFFSSVWDTLFGQEAPLITMFYPNQISTVWALRYGPEGGPTYAIDREVLLDPDLCAGYNFRWQNGHCRLYDGEIEDKHFINKVEPIMAGKEANGFDTVFSGEGVKAVTDFRQENYKYVLNADLSVYSSNYYTPLLTVPCYRRENINLCEDSPGCVWLPILSVCAHREYDLMGIQREVFELPGILETVPNAASQFYNTTYSSSAANGFDWNKRMENRWPSRTLEDFMERHSGLCAHTVRNECEYDERCKWDYVDNKCVVSYCGAIPSLVESDIIQSLSGSGDLDIVVKKARVCDRVNECMSDPITNNCVPKPNTKVSRCLGGERVKMQGTYTDRPIHCPTDRFPTKGICHKFDAVDLQCVDGRHEFCPWTRTYSPDIDISVPCSHDPDQTVSFVIDGFKRGSGHCKPRSWTASGDSKQYRRTATAQVECVSYNQVDAPAETDFDGGDHHAAANAFCDRLYNDHNLCNVHVKGRDYVCINIQARCEPKYMSLETISKEGVKSIMDEFNVKPTDERPFSKIFMSMFNHIDLTFNHENPFMYLSFFFDYEDIVSVEGLGDKVMSWETMYSRFSEHYEVFEFTVNDYMSFEPNWVKYQPTDKIIDVEVLDLFVFRQALLRKHEEPTNIENQIIRSSLVERLFDFYFMLKEIEMKTTDGKIDNSRSADAFFEVYILRNRFYFDLHSLMTSTLKLVAGVVEYDTVDPTKLNEHFDEIYKNGSMADFTLPEGREEYDLRDLARAFEINRVNYLLGAMNGLPIYDPRYTILYNQLSDIIEFHYSQLRIDELFALKSEQLSIVSNEILELTMYEELDEIRYFDELDNPKYKVESVRFQIEKGTDPLIEYRRVNKTQVPAEVPESLKLKLTAEIDEMKKVKIRYTEAFYTPVQELPFPTRPDKPPPVDLPEVPDKPVLEVRDSPIFDFVEKPGQKIPPYRSPSRIDITPEMYKKYAGDASSKLWVGGSTSEESSFNKFAKRKNAANRAKYDRANTRRLNAALNRLNNYDPNIPKTGRSLSDQEIKLWEEIQESERKKDFRKYKKKVKKIRASNTANDGVNKMKRALNKMTKSVAPDKALIDFKLKNKIYESRLSDFKKAQSEAADQIDAYNSALTDYKDEVNRIKAINEQRALDKMAELQDFETEISIRNRKIKRIELEIKGIESSFKDASNLEITNIRPGKPFKIKPIVNRVKIPPRKPIMFTSKINSLTKIKVGLQKAARALKLIKLATAAVGVFFQLIGVYEKVVLFVGLVEQLSWARKNPRGCNVIDDMANAWISLNGAGSFSASTIVNGVFAAINVFEFGNTDQLTQRMPCAERLSWSYYDPEGSYGISDYRSDVPRCRDDYRSNNLDFHFSHVIKGLNIECDTDADCRDHSSVAHCIMNRCIYPIHYLGDKVCVKKIGGKDVALDTRPVREMIFDPYEANTLVRNFAKHYIGDEFQFAKTMFMKCNENQDDGEKPFKYFHYEWVNEDTLYSDYRDGKGTLKVTCFIDCDSWDKNGDNNVDTYMQVMDGYTMENYVTETCDTSSDCSGQYAVCTPWKTCSNNVECDCHDDCNTGMYQDGRLPFCNLQERKCVDIYSQSCTTIEDCLAKAEAIEECPDTPFPTRSPTRSPTKRPTLSPTMYPTPEPTTAYPTPSPVTNSPTLSPTKRPTFQPTGSPTSSPTLSPTTASPTMSPIPNGPYVGEVCEIPLVYENTDYAWNDYIFVPQANGYNNLAIYDGNVDYCLYICKVTEACGAVMTIPKPRGAILCLFLGYDGQTNGYSAGRNVYIKDIPCVPTPAPTRTPTASPTLTPSAHPTVSPTGSPTGHPTLAPTGHPSVSPTKNPTGSPTTSPTDSPTGHPTLAPTGHPSTSPTLSPTDHPTTSPTKNPTGSPSVSPTKNPTGSPTLSPTGHPTGIPTVSPTSFPTNSPSTSPTSSPTDHPTTSPTKNPTGSPTTSPTDSPTTSPTSSPTKNPTTSPTMSPTDSPTASPTMSPTNNPTSSPTDSHTSSPTKNPTSSPTDSPTTSPTEEPLAPECQYTFFENMATFEFVQEWKVGVDQFDCLLECDEIQECIGVRHEKYTARCGLLYDEQFRSSLTVMSTTDVYLKSEKCPADPIPEIVTDFNTTDKYCEYVEYTNAAVIGENSTFTNLTISECLDYCDASSICAYVTVSVNNDCSIFGYSGNIELDTSDSLTVFKKESTVAARCVKPVACNFDEADIINGTSGLEQYLIGDFSFAEDYSFCASLCSSMFECKSFSYTPCVLYNSTLLYGPNMTYYKNDPDCGVNVTSITTPVVNVTLAPTSSPTLAPTSSPTPAPTSPPVSQLESAIGETLCDYAALPAFQPRIDGKVLHYIENNVNASIYCLFECDSSTLCVGATYHEELERCDYYTGIGPIELDFLNPTNQTLFIKSGRCHKIHFSNSTLCDYATRDEEFPVTATTPQVVLPVIDNVTVITRCAEICDTDVTCNYFTYNEMSKECLFYDFVQTWGVSSFATTFEKTEEYCALESTINNTRAPTSSPTPEPTSNTRPPTLIDNPSIGVSVVFVVLISVYASVCCFVFLCVCCTKQRDEEGLYFLVVPETLTYEIEF